MTTQTPEMLRYEGEDLETRSTPLEAYFALTGGKPFFDSICSAMWRGYVGRWEIVDGRLYLVELSGGTMNGGTEISLAAFFPGFPDRVFAHWYSGTIRLPQGRELESLHRRDYSIFERDLFLSLERGIVKSTRVRHNGTAEPGSAPAGHRVSAMTVFPRAGEPDGEAR